MKDLLCGILAVGGAVSCWLFTKYVVKDTNNQDAATAFVLFVYLPVAVIVGGIICELFNL